MARIAGYTVISHPSVSRHGWDSLSSGRTQRNEVVPTRQSRLCITVDGWARPRRERCCNYTRWYGSQPPCQGGQVQAGRCARL
jgi:hypothetical protein